MMLGLSVVETRCLVQLLAGPAFKYLEIHVLLLYRLVRGHIMPLLFNPLVFFKSLGFISVLGINLGLNDREFGLPALLVELVSTFLQGVVVDERRLRIVDKVN